MIFDPKDEIIRIEKFIKRTMETYNFKGAVIGVSGGVDSAVVLALLTRTIEKENILALILPERDSSKESVRDAKLVCNHFGVNYKIFLITGALRKLGVYSLFPPALFIPESVKISYSKKRWERYQDPYIMDLKNEGDELFLKGLAYYRIKHRVRMCKLYMEAEKRGYCVVGTTNKTELALGLYVKWGDDAVDIEPIKHLYKTQVFELAKHLGVPEKIINKKPTPDLIPGINDEDAFGIEYSKLDKILFSIESNEGKVEDIDEKLLSKVKEIMRFTKIRELKGLGIDDISNQKDRW
ncbi:MAG: NAD(+) synthase [Fervidobacterium nodosum]